MKRHFALLLLALACFHSSAILFGEELEAWIGEQPWFEALNESMPRETSLLLYTGGGEDPLWEQVQIREVHKPGSGFDPDTSPTVGIFRVSRDRAVTEWLDPVTGEWASPADFLKSREISTPVEELSEDRSTPKNELAADLDSDGKLERVRWEPIHSSAGNRYFQLIAYDDDGEVLWSGPDDATTDNAYIFFESHIGVSVPQLLHDIDADGTVELLGPEPQSDVSATYYRRLSWRNSSFSPQPSAPLMMDDAEAGKFTWRDGEHSFGIWVSRFGPVDSDGNVTAEVTQYTEEGDYASGRALLRFDAGGAAVERWIQPLGDPPPTTETRWKPSVTPEGHLDLDFKISVTYSPGCLKKLRDTGSDVTVSVIIDQYGPQYMEEEAIATAQKTVRAGDSAEFSGIPLSRASYRVDPEKAYRLTVMIHASDETTGENPIESFSTEGAVDWSDDEVQGRTLPFVCRLIGETFEPKTGGDSPFDPFSGLSAEDLEN